MGATALVPPVERPQGPGCAVLVAMDLRGATAGNSLCSRSDAAGATLPMVACAAEHACGRAADFPGMGSNGAASRLPRMEGA